jgi:late competence protein required for DNA uptake (superfamily II DNA/RNA helicase)
MAVFNFELLRTYSTMFEIEADNQQQAIDKFKALGDSIYTEEMKQCEVIEEVVKGDKYARKCDKCGQGMNEGFCIYEGQEYYCSDECLHSVYSEQEWSEMYNAEDIGSSSSYWTQWEELEEDYQYQIINGILEETDEVSYGN